jgi:hypothetical protein
MQNTEKLDDTDRNDSRNFSDHKLWIHAIWEWVTMGPKEIFKIISLFQI